MLSDLRFEQVYLPVVTRHSLPRFGFGIGSKLAWDVGEFAYDTTYCSSMFRAAQPSRCPTWPHPFTCLHLYSRPWTPLTQPHLPQPLLVYFSVHTITSFLLAMLERLVLQEHAEAVVGPVQQGARRMRAKAAPRAVIALAHHHLFYGEAGDEDGVVDRSGARGRARFSCARRRRGCAAYGAGAGSHV